MKKLFTLALVFTAVAVMQAQTSIPMTNGDCSTDATLSGSSPWIITGYSITQVSPVVVNTAASGISNGTLKLGFTTGSSTQTNLLLTTDMVDISAYPVDATFTFQCKLTCGSATATAAPYNVVIAAYDANGTLISSSGTANPVLTLTKVQPNTNVTSQVTIGATAAMRANNAGGSNAKYIALQLSLGKMNVSMTFDDFTLTKLDVAPTTTTGTPSNANLSYEVGGGPSSESTFTVNGVGLGTDNIVLTPGSNLEISLTSGSGFVASPSTISLPPTSGTVNSTTIYTRLISGINGLGAVSASSSRVTVFHQTAGTKTVQFNASVNGITVSNPLSTAIGYNVGSGPSAEQTFNVQGSGLTTDMVVTPGSNMEISTSTGSGFISSPITLTQSGGAVASTAIFARLKAGLAVSTYSDATTKITASSNGLTSKEIQFVGTVDLGTGIASKNSTDFKCIAVNGAIEISGVEAGRIIEIFNSTGQRIKSIITSGNNSIPLATCGIYFVKVNNNVKKVVLK